MRDYTRFDAYYSELMGDIYPQPVDKGHYVAAQQVITDLVLHFGDCKTVLDVGCGEAFVQPMFEQRGMAYTGITLGVDYSVARALGRNVFEGDFNFLPYDDNQFDLIFSRHSLEHSPFPLLTLMEWHRVSRVGLCVILPNPRHFTYVGRNHYSVLAYTQAVWLLQRAGWNPVYTMKGTMELIFYCRKGARIGPEGSRPQGPPEQEEE